MQPTARPPPEYFLGLIRKETRGRLKVYLGMAAGVGKTYQMLREAHRLKRSGVDVVVGYVETHGRNETADQIGDLEMVPRKNVSYRDVLVPEMDLDAILRRRPQVAIVDELPHTNTPGASRHDKRWQDVEELLEAGIHVIGAMNVQHLESLTDLVGKATGVEIRETVPDAFLHKADEVVAVDLSPEDLIDRLRAGKVYQAERIERALANFFRGENLQALREIALREVADAAARRDRRVVSDADPAGLGAKGGGRAEKVMVCMSSLPSDFRRLCRRGARMAGRLGGEWLLAYVETPDLAPERIDAPTLRALADNLEYAKTLGARVEKLKAADVGKALAELAQREHVTQALFGRTRRRRWLTGRTPLDAFMELAPTVDVVIVGVEEPKP